MILSWNREIASKINIYFEPLCSKKKLEHFWCLCDQYLLGKIVNNWFKNSMRKTSIFRWIAQKNILFAQLNGVHGNKKKRFYVIWRNKNLFLHNMPLFSTIVNLSAKTCPYINWRFFLSLGIFLQSTVTPQSIHFGRENITERCISVKSSLTMAKFVKYCILMRDYCQIRNSITSFFELLPIIKPSRLGKNYDQLIDILR